MRNREKELRTGRVEECSATSECIGLWPTYTSQINSHVKDACRSRKTYLLSHPFNDLRMRRDPLLRHTHIPLFLTFFFSRSLGSIPTGNRSAELKEIFLFYLHTSGWRWRKMFLEERFRGLCGVLELNSVGVHSLQVKEKERNSSIFRENEGILISIK